jgi:hypothetical protein
MSQIGAQQMARQGLDYRFILTFYYLEGSRSLLTVKHWKWNQKAPTAAAGGSNKFVRGANYNRWAKVNIKSGSLNFRKQAKTSAKVLRGLARGERVKIKGQNAKWYKLAYKYRKNGQRKVLWGYAVRKYLRLA